MASPTTAPDVDTPLPIGVSAAECTLPPLAMDSPPTGESAALMSGTPWP